MERSSTVECCFHTCFDTYYYYKGEEQKDEPKPDLNLRKFRTVRLELERCHMNKE